MRITAIDPGSLCGYAINDQDPPVSGVWNLKPKRHESMGVRVMRFRRNIEAIGPMDLFVFEEVRAHNSIAAGHVYGGITNALMAYCEEKGIEFQSVPIGTWKRVIVGNGHSSKDRVLKYVQDNINKKVNNFDEADAICMLHWAIQEYNQGMFK